MRPRPLIMPGGTDPPPLQRFENPGALKHMHCAGRLHPASRT